MTKKTILSFFALLLLFFLYDSVLFNVVWPFISKMICGVNVPYLRIIILRFISLMAMVLAIISVMFFVKRQAMFYFLTIITYVIADAAWLLIKTSDFVTPSVAIPTLLTYIAEVFLAIVFVRSIEKLRKIRTVKK